MSRIIAIFCLAARTAKSWRGQAPSGGAAISGTGPGPAIHARQWAAMRNHGQVFAPSTKPAVHPNREPYAAGQQKGRTEHHPEQEQTEDGGIAITGWMNWAALARGSRVRRRDEIRSSRSAQGSAPDGRWHRSRNWRQARRVCRNPGESRPGGRRERMPSSMNAMASGGRRY